MPKAQGKRLVVNVVSGALYSLLNSVLAFVLTPRVVRGLGRELLGVWGMCLSATTATGYLQLGLNSAVNREVPRGLVLGDHDRVRAVVSTALVVYLIGGLLVLLSAPVLAWMIPHWTSVSPANRAAVMAAFAITLGGLAFWVPLNIFRAVMSGLQAHFIINMILGATAVVRMVTILLMLDAGMGLAPLCAVNVASLIVPLVIYIPVAKRGCGGLAISLRYASLGVLRSIIGYSLSTFIYSVANSLFVQAGIWVVSFCLGAENAGGYFIPMRLAGLVTSVIIAMMACVKPAISSLQAADDNARLRLLFVRSVKYAFMFGGAATAGLLIFGDDILKIWLKGEPFSAPVLYVLAVGQMLFICQRVTVTSVVGIGRHRPLGILAIFTIAGGIGLAVLLAETTSLGLLAVAIGMTAPMALVSLTVVPIYATRVLGVSMLRYLASSFARPLLAMLPFLGIMMSVKFYVTPLLVAWFGLDPMTWTWMFIMVGLGGAVLIPSYWLLGFSADERTTFTRMLPWNRVVEDQSGESAGDLF